MRNKQFNKPLIGRTGKGLLSLLETKEDVSHGSLPERFNAFDPQSETEIKLFVFFEGLLGHRGFGITDDFFRLGGNSLKAIQLLSRISSHFSVDISLTDFFLQPTIAQIAALVGAKQKDKSKSFIIEAKERPQYIPLSFNQERLWFIDQLEGSLQYHIPTVIRLKGKVNKDALSFALVQIITRHEVLRTLILEKEGICYQFIQDANEWQLSCSDGLIYKNDHAGLKLYIQQLIIKPFDLSKDYMLRAELVKICEEEHVLVVTQHHIASDGWSASIIVKELLALYNSFQRCTPDGLRPLSIQYADFAIWQRQYLQGEVLNKKLAYWEKQLEAAAVLQLPTDNKRPAVQSFNGAIENFTIDKELSEQLIALSQQRGVTLFMLLLSAFKVLLHRYSGQQDITVGTAIAGRQHEELEGLIGFFINTLALRSNVDDGLSFAGLLNQLKTTTLKAFENQEVPFEKVVEAVVKERDMSRAPLFQVMFVLQNTPEKPSMQLEELVLTEEVFENKKAKFELNFSIAETPGGLQGSVEYCTDLYSGQTIKRILSHFNKLLISVINDPEQNIGSLQMLNSAEEHQLVTGFNNTAVAYPKDNTIISLFEEQVEKTPLSVAVVFEGKEINYLQLNERANCLAQYLRRNGVTAETMVPICIERGIDMIVGILGILKAGGAYVPIDPEYPLERIGYMLEDTAAAVALTSKASSLRLPGTENLMCIELDAHWPEISKENACNLPTEIVPGQLAYVIYTSGSTGKPKGVMIVHSNVVNLINSQTSFFRISADEKILQFSNYCFDASVEQIFLALFNGAALIMFPEGLQLNIDGFENFLKEQKITHLHATPAFIESLHSTGFEGLKRVIAGGDICRKELSATWKGKVDFYNEYGPTETTVTSVEYHSKIAETENINSLPIGKPVANTQVYILNPNNLLLPIGISGELCIGGAGVARGYLNLPKLTAEKFIKNIFSKEPGSKLYRTGDLGRWLPNGNIEYLGRLDDQVKIRGYRIELGEIESVINETELVRQCVVLAKEDRGGNRYLVSYVIPHGTFDKEAITSCISSKLPEYMVPAVWIELEDFPLTSNGKINKKALPEPGLSKLVTNKYIPPGNKLEIKLAEMWQKLLHVDRVGIHDNFFESGGHSLLAMRMVSAIRKELQFELSIKNLFSHPTIASFAKNLQAQNKGLLLPPVEVQPRPEHIPLSFSQERLWFIDRFEGSIPYHLPSVLSLNGHVDAEALQLAFKMVVARHEILRTVYFEQRGEAYQFIREPNDWELELITGSSFYGDKDEIGKKIKEIINTPFDLSKDYMARAALISLAEQEHLLVVTLHHIASDGWSLPIIVNELCTLYNFYNKKSSQQLPPLPIQYADYAMLQRINLQGQFFDNKLNYWKKKLRGAEPLQLPVSFARPAIQSNKGAVEIFETGKDLTEQLKTLSHQQGATLFMTVLAAFNVLLYRYTSQEDICVGTPVAGRQQQELEGLIGFFVNTLVLRNEVKGNVSFTDLLQQVKTTLLEAFEHQEIPFEKIVEAIVKERDMGRSPLFQVMFILQDAVGIEQLQLGDDLQLSYAEESGTSHDHSKFELSFILNETNSGLLLSLEYCTDLFTKDVVRQMGNNFINLLQSVVKGPGQNIEDLAILTLGEEQKLLTQFNDTKAAYPKDKSIVDLFELQVNLYPHATAVVLDGDKLSYWQLNEKANQLAHHLISKGVKEETLVAISIERSLEMIVAILGILKAGGAYVPIDPEYPVDRISFMLADTGVKILLTDKAVKNKLPVNNNFETILLDESQNETAVYPTGNLQNRVNPRSLAYIIYTSGSTGKPKGVMIEHRGVVNLALSQAKALLLKPGQATLQFSSIGFDASCYEIFNTLLSGGNLVLVKKEVLLSTEKFEGYIVKNNVEVVVLPPSFQHQVKDALGTIKTLVSAGEPLNRSVGRLIISKGIRLINAYGPTENTVCTTLTHQPFRDDGAIVIGQPIANVQVYILDKANNVCPVGITGEIGIAGTQVARGYLNRPDLTAEKFIPNPFTDTAGERMYRSGDLGRWLPDGNIEYMGRIDEQVKIRGYRIEPGEIETCIEQSGLVKQALVLAKADASGSKRLIAYVLAEELFDKERVCSFLADKLPGYMVPVLWVQLPQFPLTSNGKIDRKALPGPDQLSGAEYLAPRNEVEIKLAAIWEELLHAERVGVNDNFFELGGHSLMAMRLIAATRKDMGHDITIKDLFTYPSIGLLAQYMTLQSKSVSFPQIEIQERPEHIPLSFSQERLWFIHQLEGSVQYHLPSVFRLKGNLNRDALVFALQNIINRHEILRTVIRLADGHGYQRIKEPDEWHLDIIDDKKLRESKEHLQNTIQQLISTPFDLSKDYMLKVHLIELKADEHIMIVVMHHIAADAWSLPVIMKEVAELYNAAVDERPAQLPSLPVQYADYAIWQRNFMDTIAMDKSLEYWKQKLDNVEPLQLPTDYPRAAVLSTKGSLIEFALDKQLSNQLQAFSKQQGATLFMTLLTTFNVLLSRYSGQQDITVGTPVANRTHHEVAGLVGFFVNTLVLRTTLYNDPTFASLLRQVKHTMLEAYEHQELSFEKVVNGVVKERDMSRSPIFQVMLVLQNEEQVQNTKMGEVELSAENIPGNTSKFELIFNLTETSQGLKGAVEYCTDLYNAKTIQQMIGHFKQLLIAIVQKPYQAISKLQMLSNAETDELLIGFHNSKADYPKDKTIVGLIEEQVKKYPSSIAVVFGKEQLTYQQLNEGSNQLAHFLRSKGVGEEILVPVCLERNVEMIIAILAILKAGGAYVPIDPDYPLERISYMLADTKAGLVLCSKETLSRLNVPDNINLVVVDEPGSLTGQSKENLDVPVQPHHLAYVIYTSGSTGKPKGVLIEHRNVVRLFKTEPALYDFNEKDVWTVFHSFCFDFSVWEMYGALFYGGRMVLVPKDIAKDASQFAELILSEKVTVLNQTPSAFYVLQEAMIEKTTDITVRYVIFGGEALTPAKLRPWKQSYPNSKLINMYGITETTVHVTFQEIGWQHISGGKSVIGKLIPTLSAYILDCDKNLVPPGVAGELLIGGAGLARGYLNRPELTAERFIPDPFSKEPGARLYKTGDACAWLPDGNIEYLGRIDDQVKIRGYRIELGEIETVLQECEIVRHAIVTANEDMEGNKQLVGYIVSEGPFDRDAIVAYLYRRLPDYMIPVLWVPLNKLPLTANGKINKKALPQPEAGVHLKNEFTAPRNEAEQMIADTWQEVLNVERVGIHDNFFELGGDSIKVIRVVHKLRLLFNREVKVFDIYHTNTLAQLTPLMMAGKPTTAMQNVYAGIEEELLHLNKTARLFISDTDNVEDVFPMSDIQSGMLLASLMNPGLAIYHEQFIYRLEKNIDARIFEKAVSILINKHASFRTGFNFDIHSEGLQVIYKTVPLKVGYLVAKCIDEAGAREFIQAYLTREREMPFQINKAPLWRFTVIDFPSHKSLVFQFHHALLDGWSVASFNTELNNLCLGIASNASIAAFGVPLKCTYKDFVIESIAEKRNEENKNFWTNELLGYKRLEIFSEEPVNQKFYKKYTNDRLQILSNRVKKDGLSIKGLFHAAYLFALSMLTPEDELTVGLVSNTRPLREDSEKLLGCFLNTIPFRSKISSKEITWKTYFETVENKMREIKQRDRTTLMQITQWAEDKNLQENPFFDALYSFINFHVYDNFEEGLLAREQHVEEVETGEDQQGSFLTNTYLNFLVIAMGNTLELNYLLRKKLKSGKTLQDLNGYIEKVIDCYMDHYEGPISRDKILSSTDHSLISEISNKKTGYPVNKSVVDIFEEQVIKSPEAIAVVFENEKISYKQLNERANQLAHYLKSKGVNQGALVPLYVERSPAMMIAIIGIMKTGAAYVPVDTDFPDSRVLYMLSDTGADLIVTDKKNGARLETSQDIVIVSIDGIELDNQPVFNLSTKVQARQLAYVIYTSGSTGKPKGVMIEHRSLVDYTCGLQANTRINDCRSFALVSTIATDLGNTVIYASLLSGGALHIFSKQSVSDIDLMQHYFKVNPVDCLKIVPSHWQALCTGEDLLLPQKLLVFGGEALQSSLVEKILLSGSNCSIVNHYGPTETTIGKLLHVVQPGKVYGTTIPIGKPFSNTQVKVLTHTQHICPVGVAGQLFIAGDGVARGYFNNPDLTKQKFIPVPISDQPGVSMYATGDLVKYLPDGNIEFIGRVDDQVKIRGYRVELGEIESILQQYAQISQAVVLAREDKQGNRQLVAYVVTDGSFDKDEILFSLKENLPDYMIPAVMMEMKSLPLTANGKIDRKALPGPDVAEGLSSQYVAPRNEIETKLAEIWQDVLELEKVGIKDNFFDLGGHSLVAVRLISLIRKELKTELGINSFFELLTIEELANYIKVTETNSKDKLENYDTIEL